MDGLSASSFRRCPISSRLLRRRNAALGAAAVLFTLSRPPARGDQPEAPPAPPRARAEVVVTPNRAAEEQADVAASVTVITGEALERSGARTLSDVLADVPGLDVGSGSDAGSQLPTPSLWGVKEFAFLLVTVDGVPAGGPFDPSLALVPLADVLRIEIVKGPQATLYGLSATGGAIHVFTRRDEAESVARFSAGSFGSLGGSFSVGRPTGGGWLLKASGSADKGDGWQDRTDHSGARLALTALKHWGEGSLTLSGSLLQDRSAFGSPLPYDNGRPSQGLDPDRNLAVVGARTDHRDYALSGAFTAPLAEGLQLQGTLGFDRDEQIAVRSFLTDPEIGSDLTAAGTSLRPVTDATFADVRLVAAAHALGEHRILAGAAVTWGHMRADGYAFSFETAFAPNPVIPTLDEVEREDDRSFDNRRTFVGVYLHDEWTPVPRLTITGGVRWDSATESLRATERTNAVFTASEDSRRDTGLSGDLSVLWRALAKEAGPLDLANVWASARSTFKPAAPNLVEAESARILEPQRARSLEVGIKTRWLHRALALDASVFRLDVENQPISIVLPGGLPGVTNAGAQRFQGVELSAEVRPPAVPALSVAFSYAYHDARFVRFSYQNDAGDLVVVDGNTTELVPRHLWSGRVAYAPSAGPGGFLAVRYSGSRFLDRLNLYETDPSTEVDLGASWDFRWGRLSFVGRNLGNSRHPVTDSEIGDGQLYISPARRFTAEVTLRF